MGSIISLMCGRYVFVPSPEMVERFELQMSNRTIMEMESCYNIGPGSNEPVVVKHSPNSIETMKWGLIPPWAKDIRIGYKMINARAEKITSKPSFKRPFRYQRCLIPASGFYEWKATSEGKKPFYITVTNAPTFGMAGLYEIAHDGEGREIKSFTIITTTPNAFMAEVHDRMPVILNERDYELWLNCREYNEQQLLSLLQPFDGEMTKVPVSTRVNSVVNQGKELIYPFKKP